MRVYIPRVINFNDWKICSGEEIRGGATFSSSFKGRVADFQECVLKNGQHAFCLDWTKVILTKEPTISRTHNKNQTYALTLFTHKSVTFNI